MMYDSSASPNSFLVDTTLRGASFSFLGPAIPCEGARPPFLQDLIFVLDFFLAPPESPSLIAPSSWLIATLSSDGEYSLVDTSLDGSSGNPSSLTSLSYPSFLLSTISIMSRSAKYSSPKSLPCLLPCSVLYKFPT